MPSRLRVRERLHLRSSSRSSQIGSPSRPSSPIPPVTAPPAPTPATLAPPTPTVPVPAQNPPTPATAPCPAPPVDDAFKLALERHKQSLTPEEQKAFTTGSNISPEKLLEDVRNFDLIHGETSHSRKCAVRIEGFLTVINGYLNGIGIIIQHSPDISSLVVGGVKLVVDLGIRFASFFVKLTEMIEGLGSHLEYLVLYGKSFAHAPVVQKALAAAYGDLLEFCKAARKVFTDKDGNDSRWTSFKVAFRVLWNPFELTFSAINSRFLGHTEVVLRAAGIAEVQRLQLKETIEAEAKADEERGKVLSWLSELEFDRDHDRLFSKRHGDTGRWLLESEPFDEWSKKQKSCLLWCYGNPGAGKSVLASIVVNRIFERYYLNDRVGVAFIYFNFQDEATQTPANILSTIIKQLCRQKKVLPDQLTELYKQCTRDAKRPSSETLQEQLICLSRTFDQVLLVIDALDECRLEDRKECFLPYITRLAMESSITWKTFVTSRRERDIERAFLSKEFRTVQVEAKKVDEDIKVFVRDWINRRTDEENLCRIDQALKDRIEAALVSKAGGMFLWVQLQLNYVFEQPSVADLEDALGSLPSDMSHTYARILRKINKQVPSMRLVAKRAFMWVVTARVPLKLDELAKAISIDRQCTTMEGLDKYTGKTILDACGNLLSAEDGTVRPVHYTVQEFLTGPELSTSGEYQEPGVNRIVPDIAHSMIAESCIQALLFDGFHHWGHYPDSLKTQGYLLNYVYFFWDFHINALQELPDELGVMGDLLLSPEYKKSKGRAYSIRYQGSCLIADVTNLDFCLSFNILHIFERSNQLESGLAGLHEYEEAMHNAAGSGSIYTIQKLLDIGFPIGRADRSGAAPLYYAALHSQEGALRYILGKGADVNAQGGKYGNALQAAASSGSEQTFQALLDNGADVNAQDGEYRNALQTVQALLNHGADVNAQGGRYGNALQAAAVRGHEKTVQALLDHGADVNAQGGEYANALQAAAVRGHEKTVQALLDHGADVNAQGGEYANALQAAAVRGHEKTVQALLDHGADVNAQGGWYANALYAAVVRGHEKTVQALLDHGADVNAQGGWYGNALQAAADEGHEQTVHALLDRGADVNAQGGKYGNALYAAVVGGHEKTVQALLDRGADVNAQSGEYGYALHAAVARGHEQTVQALLDHGADVNAQGGWYGNALQAAASSGSEQTVQALLDHGADVNAQGGEYGNALQAAASSRSEQTVQALLDHGADVNAQGGWYGNALQAAAAEGHEQTVQALLDHGADVNAQGGEYGNALQAAAFSGSERTVQALLDHGADVNAQGGEYGNALQAAASSRSEQTVQALLDHGADVNAQGGEYGNALQAAAFSGSERIFQALLDHGADVNAQGGEYGNALQAAAFRGSEQTVQVLLDHGADVNAQGGEYGNALKAAYRRGYASVVKVLENHGAHII